MLRGPVPGGRATGALNACGDGTVDPKKPVLGRFSLQNGRRKCGHQRTRREAAERAEQLRPALDLASRVGQAGRRGIEPTRYSGPAGGKWFAAQVIRVRKRLSA